MFEPPLKSELAKADDLQMEFDSSMDIVVFQWNLD